MLLPREPTNQGKMLSYVQEFHVYPLVEYTSVYNNYLFTCLSPPLEYKLLRAGLSHSSSYFQKLAPCMTSSMYKINMLNNLLILFVTLHILKPKLKGDTLKKNKWLVEQYFSKWYQRTPQRESRWQIMLEKLYAMPSSSNSKLILPCKHQRFWKTSYLSERRGIYLSY